MANTGQPASHLIIPFASSLDEGCQAAIQTLALPNLTRFLKAADLIREDNGDEFDFIPPHERALGASGPVIVTPCHWSVGIDNIRMDDPADLQLTDAESKALFAAVQPYFAEDGITLSYDFPLRWQAPRLAQSHALQGLALASLDRVIGHHVDVWQPQSEASKAIRRLQNEMQMLLYTHPINEAREAKGLPTVNSFWLSRAPTSCADNVDSATAIRIDLRHASLRGDWQTWAATWQALDSKGFEGIHHITLCGERNAHTYALPATRSFGNKITRFFKPAPGIQSVLTAL
jgi:hypothetical protein